LGFALTGFASLGSEIAVAINFAALFVILLPSVGVLLPVWFPTGMPPSPRWRWVEITGLVSASLFAFSIVLGLVNGDFNDDIDGCYSASACIEVVSLLATLVATLFAVASLVVRWVRSEGMERQQLKLMAAAFVMFALATGLEFGGGQGLPLVEAIFTIASLLIPASLAATISAYRLYDIDRILTRTISYAIVLGVLGGVYLLGLTALTTLFPAESPLAVAASTLAAAALFNPVRTRVQTAVEKHFNRSRYDAQRVMEMFSGSLREDLDPDAVLGGWVEVVAETMQPSSVGVWVRP
jgi:hypothetical protein